MDAVIIRDLSFHLSLFELFLVEWFINPQQSLTGRNPINVFL